VASLDAGAISTGTFALARLPTSGVTAGTYKSVTVDTYGRVTAATNPTTIVAAGYTDGVIKGGQAGALTVGPSDANILTLQTAGTARITVNAAGETDIRGQVRSVNSTGASYDNTAASVDWDRGNTQSMSVACTATAFTNMLDGGVYTLAVTETTATTCVFSQSGLTFLFNPVNQNRVAGMRSVYTFQRIGTSVYVSWVAGFQ
jgi:phage-related tail fiber protein